MDIDEAKRDIFLDERSQEELEELLSLSSSEFTLNEYKKYGIDLYGFGSDGYTALDFEKRDTDHDVLGFNRKGYRNGFDINGISKDTNTEYDFNGLNNRHFFENGINFATNTEFDIDGFNKEGFNAEGKHYKENIPYYQIAKNILLNENKDLPEEQVREMVISLNINELDKQVGAKKSVTYALQGILDYLVAEEAIGVSEARKYFTQLSEQTFYGEKYEPDDISEILYRLAEPNEFVISILSKIHNGWVKDCPQKFSQEGENKQFKHMPIELIGWEEVKSDLIFVKPILEKLGMSIDEQQLEGEYNERVANFLGMRNINGIENLRDEIVKSSDFYSALEGQDEIINALSNPQFVETTVIPQIIEKSFGNVETMQRYVEIYKKTGVTILPEDMQKALASVRSQEQSRMADEIKAKQLRTMELEQEIDSLEQKNKIQTK